MTDAPRTPPTKIRVTKLQEAQLPLLERIEHDAAAEPWGETEIARLTRRHDVLVAEADNEVAGYLAWADEAPGVAHLVRLVVDPERQRFGIGTRLLRELGEAAAAHGIVAAVTPVGERASGAMAFLAVRGFAPLDGGTVPEQVGEWAAARGAEVVAPGQRLWWATTDGLGTIPGLPRP